MADLGQHVLVGRVVAVTRRFEDDKPSTELCIHVDCSDAYLTFEVAGDGMEWVPGTEIDVIVRPKTELEAANG